MAQQYGTSQRQELSQRRITLDPRTFLDRVGASLTNPRTYARFQISMAVLACVLAFVWLPITVFMVLL